MPGGGAPINYMENQIVLVNDIDDIVKIKHMNIQNLQLKTDILVYTIIGIEKEFNQRYPGIDMNFIKHRRNTEKRGYKQYDAIQW